MTEAIREELHELADEAYQNEVNKTLSHCVKSLSMVI